MGNLGEFVNLRENQQSIAGTWMYLLLILHFIFISALKSCHAEMQLSLNHNTKLIEIREYLQERTIFQEMLP